MNDLATQLLGGIVAAAIGSASTIALFRSKLDTHSQAINQLAQQRNEDRETDRRENERIRQEFRDLCTTQNSARERELEYIRRQVEEFRNQIAATDRRQRTILDIVSDIARVHKVARRVTDPDHYAEDSNG